MTEIPHEKARRIRFATLAAKVGAQIQARKYVRLDLVKEGRSNEHST